MRFEEIRISQKILDKAKEMGFQDLTPIQEKCIPLIQEGKDVVGQAETGSGKTVAFALPILDRMSTGKGPQVLVLTPTRELCIQVTDVFNDFGKPLGIKSLSVYGGVSLEEQARRIPFSDVIVGTPGRMLDHMRRHTIDLKSIRFLVLDETDKMFEMGFIEDVEDIINQVPKERQTLMFSATISYDVHQVMKRHLKDAEMVSTKPLVDARKLKQVYYDIQNQNEKFSLLVHLLKNKTEGLAIVFCATRNESDIITRNLRNHHVNAMAIHGGMTQHKREQSLEALKKENIDVLVATDVAARGLDIKNVTHVYNYDVPGTTKDYIHRIGRTARAGEKGDAVTLLTHRDHDNFRAVLRDGTLNIDKADMPRFKRIFFKRYQEERGAPRRRYGSGPRRHSGPHRRPRR